MGYNQQRSKYHKAYFALCAVPVSIYFIHFAYDLARAVFYIMWHAQQVFGYVVVDTTQDLVHL